MNEEIKTRTGQFREITIPGDVLDDESLSDGAKIMYGKIARLSQKSGVCNASNYFLDGTRSGRNASRFIAELKNAGVILVENEKSKYRKIKICKINSRICHADSNYTANSGEVEKNSTSPILARSNYIANSGEVENNSTSPILAKSNPLHRQFRRGETPYIANSGEQTVVVEVENTTTTPASQKFIKNPDDDTAAPKPNEEPLPTVKSVVEASFTPEGLKNALLALDRTLILSAGFYPKAIDFMHRQGLDSGYLTWLYEQCELKNPNSFDGYYFNIFFLENMAEKYKAVHKPASPPPPDDVKCPACSAVHDKNIEACPNCSLPKDSSPQTVSLFRQLLTFSLDRRNEYLKRENLIHSEFKGDSFKIFKMIDALNKEFNLEERYEKPSRSYHP
jgi:hypothetical protein